MSLDLNMLAQWATAGLFPFLLGGLAKPILEVFLPDWFGKDAWARRKQLWEAHRRKRPIEIARASEKKRRKGLRRVELRLPPQFRVNSQRIVFQQVVIFGLAMMSFTFGLYAVVSLGPTAHIRESAALFFYVWGGFISWVILLAIKRHGFMSTTRFRNLEIRKQREKYLAARGNRLSLQNAISPTLELHHAKTPRP